MPHKESREKPADAVFARKLIATGGLLTALLFAGVGFWATFSRYASEQAAAESDRLTQRQMLAQARELAVLSLRYNRCNGYAYYFLGSVELLLERYSQAIEVLEQGRRYMPHLTQLLKLLAQAYYFADKVDKVVATLDAYLTMDPAPKVGGDNILRMWSQALSQSREFGRGTIALARASTYDTYREEILQTRILNSVLLNQTLMADYYYRGFKHACPKKPLEPVALFSSALAANKMDTLIRFLELNRLRGEMDATSEKILAMGYAKQGRLHEALIVLQTAARMAPNDPELALFLGDLYYQLGDAAKARGSYRRHLQLAPESKFRKDLLQKFPDLEEQLSETPTP